MSKTEIVHARVTYENKDEEDLEFTTAVATVDGASPSEETKRIFLLYKRGYIDLETAKFMTGRLE